MSARMRGVAHLLLVAASVAVPEHRAEAQQADAQERGRQIALEAHRRSQGFGDYQARLEMILVDRRGEETVRELELLALEVSADEERWLVYFHSPPDIRGTGLLTYSFRDGDTEQWLYLPALRRTKRISASGRSSPFLGSEFAYEDLAPTYPSQYRYDFVGEETLDGVRSFVVDRYPTYDGTGYSRQRLWFDQDEYRLLRVESWDLRDRTLKTLTLSGYQRYLDRIWQPTEAVMVNQRTDAVTRLRWSDYRFGTGLVESDFSRAQLGRVR